MLEDVELENISDTEVKNLAINCYSCLKENGKKINYMSYIKQMGNKECNNAIKRTFKSIDVLEIEKFIDNIEGMEKARKEFYKKVMKVRYEILRAVYEKI